MYTAFLNDWVFLVFEYFLSYLISKPITGGNVLHSLDSLTFIQTDSYSIDFSSKFGIKFLVQLKGRYNMVCFGYVH